MHICVEPLSAIICLSEISTCAEAEEVGTSMLPVSCGELNTYSVSANHMFASFGCIGASPFLFSLMFLNLSESLPR